MSFLVCMTIALILIMSLPESGLTIYAHGQEQFLTHKEGKFAIQYPSDWKKEIQSYGVSFSVPNTTVVFSIHVQSLGDFDSLEQFVDSQVQDIQSLGSNRQIPDGLSFATIDGQRVIRAESESSFGEKTLHLWTVADDDTFTFDLTTREDLYREYLPTVEKMIDSFRFVNVPAEITKAGDELETLASNNTAPSPTDTALGISSPLSKPSQTTSPQQTNQNITSPQASSTVPLLESQSAQEQQWVTYQNPHFGITIQHPSDWEVISSNTDSSPPAKGLASQIVEFGLPAPASDEQSASAATGQLASLSISMQIADSYLNTETMQVEGASLEDYIAGKRSEIMNMAIPSGELGFKMEYIRDNKTTVGGNPAWNIEYMSSLLGEQVLYYITTYVMKDEHLYNLEFNTAALKAPEMIPIAQKMIDSFKITVPTQPPLTATNTPSFGGPEFGSGSDEATTSGFIFPSDSAEDEAEDEGDTLTQDSESEDD